MTAYQQHAALQEDLRNAQIRLGWLADALGSAPEAKAMVYAGSLLARVMAEVESLRFGERG